MKMLSAAYDEKTVIRGKKHLQTFYNRVESWAFLVPQECRRHLMNSAVTALLQQNVGILLDALSKSCVVAQVAR